MKRKVIIIFGKTGTGKTYLAKKIIEQYSRVMIFDRMGEYRNCLVIETLDDFINYFSLVPESFIVACRFEVLSDYEYAAKACEIIGNLLLVLEEATGYLTSRKEVDCYMSLILHGRHNGISLLGISQRPMGISINFRDMSTTRISFAQDSPESIAYLTQWGFNGEEILNLKEYAYCVSGEPLDGVYQTEKKTYLA